MVVVKNTFKLQVEASARLLSIMSNPSRIHILKLLTQREWDVNSLAQHVNLSQSALSQHLKKMRDAKLVEWRQQCSGCEHNRQRGCDRLCSTGYPFGP